MVFKAGHKINKNRARNDLKLDLTGKKFGRLSVIKFAEMRKNRSFWKCKCDCGKELYVNGTSMVGGNTNSCGCYGRDQRIKAIKKHGMRDDPFYKNWCAMRARCSNPNQRGYKNWGGRGINVCDRWQIFLNFKEDMYEDYLSHISRFGRKNTSIDRIDNNKNYCKNNCKWSTRIEQNSNTTRSVIIEFNGKKLTMSEWARRIGVDRSTILYRVFKAKWPLEKALSKKNMK